MILKMLNKHAISMTSLKGIDYKITKQANDLELRLGFSYQCSSHWKIQSVCLYLTTVSSRFVDLVWIESHWLLRT